jgi:hypothetical protein
MNVSQQDFEHGTRALNRMRELIYTEFAPLLRVLTKQPRLKVEPHPTLSATDGKKVMLVIPWELGETQEHDRSLCGKRDQNMDMECPACRTLDHARSDAYHESAHLTEKTFEQIAPFQVWQAITEEFGPELDAMSKQERDQLRWKVINSPTTLQGFCTIDPWFQMTWNAIEDIYVNRRLFKARPGTVAPMLASTRRLLMEGFKRMDGSQASWADSDENFQAIMAAYLMGAEMTDDDMRKRFEKVDALFDDVAIRDLMDSIPGECGFEVRARTAFKLLAELRKHGYCPRPSYSVLPPPPPPPPPPSQDEQQDEPQDSDEQDEQDDEQEPQDGESESDDESEAEGQGEPCSEGEQESDDESESSEAEGDGEADDKDDESESEADEKGSGDDSEDDESADEAEGSGDTGDGQDETETEEQGDDEGDADDEAETEVEGESQGEEGSESDDDEGEGEGSDADDQADDEGDDEQDGEGEDQGSDADDQADDDQDGEGDGQGSDADDQADDDEDEQNDDGEGGEGASGASQDDPDAETDDEQGDGQEEGPTDQEIQDMIEQALRDFLDMVGHGEDKEQEPEKEDALERAIKQSDFDEPSENLDRVEVKDYSEEWSQRDPGCHLEVPESVIARPKNHLRVVFAENRKVGLEGSLKSGPRLDNKHLHRVGSDDFRIFGRRSIPKRRDWFVVVGLDISSSNNSNGALRPMKEAASAVGQMLQQLGVKFVMEAHTSTAETFYDSSGGRQYRRVLIHCPVKAETEVWDARTLRKLEQMYGQGGNMDGHSLERYRKLLDANRATDKLLMYFTDGEMHGSGEEGEVMQRNIELCLQRRYNLLAIAYKNDSPKDFGFDCVTYKDGRDVATIVAGLDRHLSRH